GFYALGTIPIRAVLLIVIFVSVSIGAMVRGLFSRRADLAPGPELDLVKLPDLRRAVSEVAQRIGTRPADVVYVTPGAQIAVFERGGVVKQLAGRRQRCLILGVATLEGLSIRPFKSILAHEYGHFSNRDTAGGAFALAVRRSVGATAQRLFQSGNLGRIS